MNNKQNEALMLNRHSRKINLDVIDRQLEALKEAKTTVEKALIEKLSSEVRSLNDQFVSLLRSNADLLNNRDIKLSYAEIEAHYSAQIDAFAKQLTILGETMIDGRHFDNAISEKVKEEIAKCGRYLQLLAMHKPVFKFSPAAQEISDLCTSLGGFGISIGQEMQNFTILEVITRKNGAAKVEIQSSLGECAGIQHKWASEVVANGTARYPIAISMDVSCYQDNQSVIQKNQYSVVKTQALQDVNVLMMLEKLQAGVPHLLALRNDERNAGHALGLRRHPDCVEIVDPNFGYFFFRDTTKAAVWLNAVLQMYHSIDFPCSQLELAAYSAMSAEDIIKPSKFPTQREIEKDFAKPHTTHGYQAMVKALQQQFINLFKQASDEKLAGVMIKSFDAFIDCVGDQEIQELKLIIESFIDEDQSLDEKITTAYCGSIDNYNKLKQVMLVSGISGCTNLFAKLRDYNSSVALIPPDIVSFMEQVETVEKALAIALNDLAIRKHEAEKDGFDKDAKELDYQLRILGMKQEKLIKAAIVPTLKAEFARDRKCDLDKAIAVFKEQVGTALDPNELQPHLKELKAIDAAKEALIRYCERYREKYSPEEMAWRAGGSVSSQVKAVYERAENDVGYEMAVRKIAELEKYAEKILSTAAQDASQSIRDERFNDLLKDNRVSDVIDTEKDNRFNRNMEKHEEVIQALSIFTVEACVKKLEALNVNNDQWSNPEFKTAVGNVLALQNEVRKAMYSTNPKRIVVADYHRTLESILVDIENIGKADHAKAIKPASKSAWKRTLPSVARPVAPVVNVGKVDVLSDASVSKSDDHESDAEDTSNSNAELEEIVVNERPTELEEIVVNERDAVAVDISNNDTKVDVKLPVDLLDEMLLEVQSIISNTESAVIDAAVTSLIEYRKSLSVKLQANEELARRTQDISVSAELGRKQRLLNLSLAFAQRKIEELQLPIEKQTAESRRFVTVINDFRNDKVAIEAYCDEQLQASYDNRMSAYGESADSILGIYTFASQAELSFREINKTPRLEESPVYQRTLPAITKLQEDIWFDMYGMLADQKDVKHYQERLNNIQKDLDSIKVIVSKQKDDEAASELQVSYLDVEAVVMPKQPEMKLSPEATAFLKDLEILRKKIAGSQYGSKKQFAKPKEERSAAVLEEETVTNDKLRLIDKCDRIVRANKSANLGDLLNSFIKAEFTLALHTRPGSTVPDIISKQKNSDILFKHRRTSGFLSIFNRTYKTDTEKLFDKYRAEANKSRKRKRGCC